MKYYINKYDSGVRIKIWVELNEKQPVAPGLTVDLEPAPETFTELTIFMESRVNGRDNSAGQDIETVREFAKRTNDRQLLRLCELWERYHLNGNEYRN